MNFEYPLSKARFIQRYKRFFADVELEDGRQVVAHVPNTGSLKSVLFPNAPCLVSESNNPKRKLKATLHFLKTPTSWVGVDTSLPNQLVYEAWERQMVAAWTNLKAAQREYWVSQQTRLDLVLAPTDEDLEAKTNLHFIEVKNVTLAENGTAYFPDAVTARGQKHLRELMTLKNKGFGAEVLFVIQREDCASLSPAEWIDPEYADLLRQAHEVGVTIRALHSVMDPGASVELSGELPVRLQV